MNLFGRLLQLFGINHAIGYGLLVRLWSLASFPVTFYLVSTLLSLEEQGFYYTMMSLLGLQVFFELGLAAVLSQFFSHEFVKLRLIAKGRISGDRNSFVRLNSLLSQAASWFVVASLLLASLLILLGLRFFDGVSSDVVSWQIPWVFAALGVSSNLLLVPLIAIESSSGNISEIYRREAGIAVLGALTLWLCLLFNVGLYGIGATFLVRFLVFGRYFLRYRPVLLRSLFRYRTVDGGVDWWREVWPMQWRVSFTWISGYFVLQLFNPVLFYYHGPAEAGRMGISIAALNALIAIALIWPTANAPMFGRLVAHREWQRLDALFWRVLLQAGSVAFIGALIGSVIVAWLQHGFIIGNRFLPYPQVAMLLFAASVQVLISSFSVYLRAYKREPLFVISIIHAVLQGGATLIIGSSQGASGLAVSILVINLLVILPLTFIIWRRCRILWQRPVAN